MIIDNLELKKICIRYAGIDMHPVWDFKSKFTKKRVDDTLKSIKQSFGEDRVGAEQSIISMIRENWQNGRKKIFAKLLLIASIPEHAISEKNAKSLANELGIYNSHFENYISKHFSRESTIDIFEELAGQQGSTNQFQPQRQPELQLAASLKNK